MRGNCVCVLQSHGQPDEEDGWASSDANSDAVQRSAHSTPQAGSKGPFSPPADPAPISQDTDLQVTTRSMNAIITKPKHKQAHSGICLLMPAVALLRFCRAFYRATLHACQPTLTGPLCMLVDQLSTGPLCMLVN